MSRQANDRRMRALVARWRGKGGSAAAFAARHGVSANKFGYWRRRLSRVKSVAKAEAVDFQPVHLVGPVGGGAPMEIAFATGERVLVPEGISAETLAMVISALRSRC